MRNQLVCTAVVLSSLATVAVAQSGDAVGGSRDNPLVVPQAAAAVRIDGVLDDEAWRNALVVELPFEVSPAENTPAPVRTECLLSADRSHLYVAFRAHDPESAAIRARLSDRDTAHADDWVGVVLDTFDDERRAYDFIVNPLGVQMDLVETRSGADDSWDAIWDSAGRIHSWGYAVEMAIPFNQLRFQRSDTAQVWGFDAVRRYPRDVAHRLGAFARDRNNDCYLCQSLKISGFAGASPGQNIQLSPTVTGVRTEQRASLPDGAFETLTSEVEGGLTARWGFTANLTLSATLNPDFSQVEADSLQLDINRPFALYFPEKRPFFVEGADFFDTLVDVVYTRTMRDPEWGIKITGKEGANTIGAYAVRDEVTNLIFPGDEGSSATSLDLGSTASVFRYKRDLGSRHTLGLMLTDRDGGGYSNRVMGIDGVFRLTETDSIQLHVLRSETEYPDALAAAFGQPVGRFSDEVISFEYDHEARNAGWWLDYEEVGPNFRADLGFVPMVGYVNVEGGANYKWIAEPGKRWTQLRIGNELNWYDKSDGGLLYRNASVWLSFSGTLQSWLYLRASRSREAFNGVEFDLESISLSGGFTPTANFEMGVDTTVGDVIDYDHTRPGRRFRISPQLIYRPGRHLRLDLQHVTERMRVDGGRLYSAAITQGKAIYQFNRRTFVRAILQYVDYEFDPALYAYPVDDSFKRLQSQLLFSYKINPQTVLFLGYSDSHVGGPDFGLTQADRTLFAKLGYAWVW